MATIPPTTFPAPGPQTYTPPNSQPYQPFTQHKFSPVGPGPATSMNQSPSSVNASGFPNPPSATRQLRPPKSPMYIPAALRPTDRPPRPSPLTPPRSAHGSTDSLENAAAGRPLSRRSTTDSRRKNALDKVAEDDLTATLENMDNSDLPSVTGLPRRDHWKPDANAHVCDGATCHKNFGLFERRHHCRHCGNIFCNEHSTQQIPLDQNADFHPKGAQCRACSHCWNQYRQFRNERISMANSTEEVVTPNTPIKLMGSGSKSPEGQKGAVSSSVTRDYNWSTF